MRRPSGRVTLRDIARELGVSTAAVSKALNDLPGVSDALRLRVKKMADRLGYAKYLRASVVNAYERSLKFLVVLYGRIGEHIIHEIQRGIEGPIRKKGYCELRYLIDVTQEPRAEQMKELFLRKIAHEKGVVGILSCYLKLSDVLIAQLYERGLPVVLLENATDFGRCVVFDNVKSSYRATAHLLNRGRRRIGCILPHEDIDHVWRDRLEGYKRALREAGVAYDPTRIVNENFVGVNFGAEATLQLLRARPDVDAILYGSDLQAYGGLKALRQMGRRVPEDVAVIGFDDMEFNEAVVPRLSSVRLPVRKMAQLGMQLLTDSIEKGDLTPRQIVLDTELVLRESA